jgi:hypothetical protein
MTDTATEKPLADDNYFLGESISNIRQGAMLGNPRA